MKHFTTTITYSIIISLLLCSCQKSPAFQPSSNNMASSVNSTDEVSLSRETLTLRPGPDNGQDVYVDKEIGVKPSNLNYVPELNANAWTINGIKYGSGSFIRFDGLSAISNTSTVISANLYLYGLPSSASTPQGNYGDNACYVRRVLNPWDESTLVYSFNNLPASTDEGQAILPASTSQWNYNPVVDVTAMVAYMVAHPGENYGFSISLITQQKYRSIVFGSSEQSDENLRPKLVVVYKNISNPLAGPYLWDFKRWDWTDSTTVALSSLSFFGAETSFSPDDPTTIEVPSGYFIQPRYVLAFDNNDGVLSNFQLSMNAEDVAVMAANGVTITDGPNILFADPISRTFEFQYTVLNTIPANRYIVDKYYKP